MSPAKKQNAAPPPRWLQAWRWLLGRGRPLLMLLVLAGLFVGGAIATWRWLGPRILGSPEYRVTAERIEITPPPEWIHSDIRAEVFRDPTLDGPLSIMDDDLAERIYRAFARHPWVAKVIRVNKQKLKVELVYRRPVCMVEVPGGLLPVDGEGILLPPGDFSPSEAAGYPRLTGVERGPTGGAGKPLARRQGARRGGDRRRGRSRLGGHAVAADRPLARRSGRRNRGRLFRPPLGRAVFRAPDPRRHPHPLGLRPRRQRDGRTARRGEARPLAALPGRPRHPRRPPGPAARTGRPHDAALGVEP